MEGDSTLRDEIKQLTKTLDGLLDSGRVKGFKPPKKINNRDLKKNYILAIIIGENREIKFMKLPISEGTMVLEKAPRLATADYMLSYKGKPALILPEWSTKPFSPEENYEESAKNNMLAAGYKLLLNRMELGNIKTKRGLSGAMIFAIVIGLIVVGYLLIA
ncbi:MAG: hypothetical protein JSW08_00055 [archaeon]|nr:MAG: hypothetical protein JSW08_00055 [archaeon]